MSEAWAVELEAPKALAAGSLRLRPGIRACRRGDAVWLLGDTAAEDLRASLRGLGGKVYGVDETGKLTLVGERTPCGQLSEERWVPLGDLLTLAPQAAALPGTRLPRIAIQLVRGGVVRDANVLLTSLAEWGEYTATAAARRLRPLRFAADTEGKVIVHGFPLPPISGERWVESHGIAVACGYEWRPRIDAAVLATLLGLAEGDVGLLDGSTGGTRGSPALRAGIIRSASFVPASRSGVRRMIREAAP